MNIERVVQTWEFWTTAKMLIAAHGDDAEAHAQARIVDADEREDESALLVWRGVLAQLAKIRVEDAGKLV